jgi:hypothetical protein
VSQPLIHRAPWSPDFPDVVVHNDLARRDAHSLFPAAKSGDADAATSLVLDLISIDLLRAQAGVLKPDTILLAVGAIESHGFNAIPDAMALVMSAHTNICRVSDAVNQTNKVAHTRSTGWHRFVTPATFGGPVETGADYLLIDDHIGHGGTLANLRGHIEHHGGKVAGMMTLTETRDARTIAIRPETLSVLRGKHGRVLEDFWREQFGYGLDCLTEVEACYLARQSSFDTIRTRMAEASEEAGRRGLSAATIETGG